MASAHPRRTLQVLDEAVLGNQTQAAASTGQQAAQPQTDLSLPQPDAQHSTASELTSDQRRVVQRINSQSTPQNPAGPSQAQPSGLALATAPVSNPSGVIINHRPLDDASIDAELPRTASGHVEADANDNKRAELHSHPLTQTPSRKRSFTPSEASSSIEAATVSDSMEGHSNEESRTIIHSRNEGAHRSNSGLGGLVPGPVQWAARGAGRLMGTLFRRSSRQ